MTTISALLDRAAAHHGSDAAAARAAGLSRQDIYLARRRWQLSDSAIVSIAASLGSDPGHTLAAIRSETASTDAEMAAWRSLAAAALLVSAGSPTGDLYYVKSEIQKNPPCDTDGIMPTIHCLPLSEKNQAALDVLRWCLCVAHVSPDSPRLSYYVSRWDVPAKIAVARAQGRLDAEIAGCPPIDLRHLPAAHDAIAEWRRYQRLDDEQPSRDILPRASRLSNHFSLSNAACL